MEDPAGFWGDIASEFYWKQKWGDQVVSENLDVRKGPIQIEVGFFSFLLFFLSLVKCFDIYEIMYPTSGSRGESPTSATTA